MRHRNKYIGRDGHMLVRDAEKIRLEHSCAGILVIRLDENGFWVTTSGREKGQREALKMLAEHIRHNVPRDIEKKLCTNFHGV